MNVKATPPEGTYNLELQMSRAEAAVLLAIARAIGGDPLGPRSVILAISQALLKLGLQTGQSKNSGSIYFQDTWAEFEETIG